MTTKEIGIHEAVSLLSEAVNIKGEDYVDPSSTNPGGLGCVNATKDKDGTYCASCIVGHALASAGVPLKFLYDYTGGAISTVKQWRCDGDGSVVITNGAAIVFRAAQGVQDDGGTWGQALKHADIVRWALEEFDVL